MITVQKRIWSLFNNGIEFIIGIGMVAAITRIYPGEMAGTWFLFIAVFGLAGSLRDALIQSAMVKGTVGVTDDKTNEMLKTNFAVTFAFELLSGLVIILTGLLLHNALGTLLLFYPLYAIPNAWFRWQVFYLRSQLRIKEIVITNLANLFTIGVGIFLLYSLSLPLYYMIILMGIGSINGGVIASHWLPYRKIGLASVSGDSLRTIRHYGIYAMLREATTAISSRISLFYSSALLTLQQTAFLGVSQRFAQIALLPNNAFQSLLFPSLMKHVHEGDILAARKTFESSIAQLLAFTIPFALAGALLSPFILELLSGPQYRSAWGVMIIYLLLSTLITPFGSAFGSLVTALGKPHIAFKVVVVNSVLNTLFGFFFMKWWGLAGAPLALFITEIFGFIWVGIILHQMAGIRFVHTFKEIPVIYLSVLAKSISFIQHIGAQPRVLKK